VCVFVRHRALRRDASRDRVGVDVVIGSHLLRRALK
jgi:hypothetical protein